MRIAIVWGLLLAICGAIRSDPERVATLTRQFVEAAKNNDSSATQFYDINATLSVDPRLGFGGYFKGPDGVGLFLYRMFQDIQGQPAKATIIDIDEARGTALVSMDVSGVFVRTGKHFNTTLLHVLEWNQVTGKIMSHVVLDANLSQTLKAYQTAAEASFERLLWTLFRSSYEQITDVDSAIWDLISDNIIVKLNAYPEDLLSKTIWQGKSEVIKGFTEMEELKQNMPLWKHLMTRSDMFDAKVIVSNDTDVWVRWGYKHDHKLITHAVVHYSFDRDGKLLYEEITLAHAAKPWHVYPFPAPKQPTIAAHDVRKLLDAQNEVTQPISAISEHQRGLHVPFTQLRDNVQTPESEGKLQKPKVEETDDKKENPAFDLDVQGDVKTSIVTFGSGKANEVKFVGMIDEIDVDQPKIFVKSNPV